MDVKETVIEKGRELLDGPTKAVLVLMWIVGVVIYFAGGTFLTAICATILFSILIIPAAIAGNFFRKTFCPSFVITSGVGGLVKAKLFWMFGPQVIGVFIAMLLSMVVITSKDQARADREQEDLEKHKVLRAEEQKIIDVKTKQSDTEFFEQLKTVPQLANSEDWVNAMWAAEDVRKTWPTIQRDELDTEAEFEKRGEADRAKLLEAENAVYRKAGFEVGKLYRFKGENCNVSVEYHVDNGDNATVKVDDSVRGVLSCYYYPVHDGRKKWPFVVHEYEKIYFSLFGKTGTNNRPNQTRFGVGTIPFTIEEIKQLRGDHPSISDVPKDTDIVVRFPSPNIVAITVK